MERKPPLPPPPYLKPAPEMSAWTVLFANAKAPKAEHKNDGTTPGVTPPAHSGMSVRQINVVRTKDTRLVVISYSNGEREEMWGKKGAFVENTASGYIFTRYEQTPNRLLEEYQVSDFPDFRWVSKDTYIGSAEIDQRVCLVFQKAVPTKELAFDYRTLEVKAPAKASANKTMTAWIDAETRLPVQWVEGNEVRRVIFTSPPATPLSLPGKVAEIFAELDKFNAPVRFPRGG